MRYSVGVVNYYVWTKDRALAFPGFTMFEWDDGKEQNMRCTQTRLRSTRLASTVTSTFALLALAACGEASSPGDDTGIQTQRTDDDGPAHENSLDRDGDAIVDSEDPTPDGSAWNKFAAARTGGSARIVEITATFDGVVVERLVYSRDLNAGCVEYYAAQAALCDESDSREVSARVNPFSGPSWGNYRGRVRGVFVVDACHDGSCDAVDFNEAWVFQTFAYGKITHIRLSVHESRNGTAPSWHDDGWLAVFDPQLVGPGTDLSGDGTLVGDPTILQTGPQVARYLRVEVINDGSLGGDTGFIDFRQIKLFSRGVSAND